jgi:hypothetical protein
MDKELEAAEIIDWSKLHRVKIIQILLAPNDNCWQGALLGLGDDGTLYRCGSSGRWELFVPPYALR